MKKFILCIIVIMACHNSYGQLLKNYLDAPGKFIRKNEKKRARELKNETSKTATRYPFLEITSLAEKASKTRNVFNMSSSAFINHNNYKNVCRSYLNPLKKKTCSNRYNYLISAHKKVLEFVSIKPKNKVNIGIKEQIGEKYTRITNMIFLELEKLKLKAEKDNYYTLLFIK